MNLSIQILFFSFILLAFAEVGTNRISTVPEICNNAIDDDGDGEIDLNDSDCFCDLLKPISFIPNPSFEDQDCCPEGHSSVHCATSWLQASEATPDYFHTCDWTADGALEIPQPLPDGEGFIGFIDGVVSGDVNPNWKEYVGTCLTSPLQIDSLYRFQFDLGFLDRTTSPDTDIVIFGTQDCANLPFGNGDATFGCPTNSSKWVRLGSISAFGKDEWKRFSFTFKPKNNITAVVVGPDCYHRTLIKDTYYFLDNLVLTTDAAFDVKIKANAQPCAADLAFEITHQNGNSYQWYKDGIAILGATASILNNPSGAGKYEVKVTNEKGCKVSEPYIHDLPFYSFQVTQTICTGDSYFFDNQPLTEPGVYWDTLRTINNCDSIIRLELKHKTPYVKAVKAKIFPSETYAIGPFRYTTAGEYKQTITAANGCDSTVNLQLDYYTIYTPNVFSPNGDGKNDEFSLFGGADLQKVVRLQIFDRWGNLMYEGADLASNEGWDGVTNGETASEGIYLYQAKVLMDDAQERRITGTITLIR